MKTVSLAHRRPLLFLLKLPLLQLSSLALFSLLSWNSIADVTTQSPQLQSMSTQRMDKSLVQDLERVGERLFLAGERGHIGWSDDNGQTWIQAQVPTIMDITALFFASQETGWAVGHDGNIFHTTDGGKTWQLQLDGLAFNITRAKAKVLSVGSQLGALQTELETATTALNTAEEAGEEDLMDLEIAVEDAEAALDDLSWETREAQRVYKEENAPWPLMDIWFSDNNNGYAVGAFNTLLITRNGGKSWQDNSQLIDNPDGLHLNTVNGYGSTVFVLGEAGIMYRSTDSGNTWQTMESPDYGSFFAMHVDLAEEPDTLDIIILGLRGSIFRSADNGDSWQQLPHDANNNVNDVAFNDDGSMLVVGNDGTLLKSNDNGQSFIFTTRTNQLTLSSVIIASNGNYILGGAGGIQIVPAGEL